MPVTDSDRDGLPDSIERGLGTDPHDRDSDDDGLSDAREQRFGSDPRDADSDGDGLRDGREVFVGTDPMDADTDDDGTRDRQEVRAGTLDNLDVDRDGTADWLEERDRERTQDELDSLDGKAVDSDGDGLSDVQEKYWTHTDPNNPDTDSDGTWDWPEVRDGSDPRYVDNSEPGQDWVTGHDHYVDGVGLDPAHHIEEQMP